jgi:hypothetical protein
MSATTSKLGEADRSSELAPKQQKALILSSCKAMVDALADVRNAKFSFTVNDREYNAEVVKNRIDGDISVHGATCSFIVTSKNDGLVLRLNYKVNGGNTLKSPKSIFEVFVAPHAEPFLRVTNRQSVDFQEGANVEDVILLKQTIELALARHEAQLREQITKHQSLAAFRVHRTLGSLRED